MSNTDPRPGDQRPTRERPELSTAALADAGEPAPGAGGPEPRSFAADDDRGSAASLLTRDEVEDLRDRWTSIQAGFVDEPRQAVQDADGLVAQTMKRLAEMFAEERSNLERQWDRGDEVSTEELRVALQRYRSFFDRLLSF